MRVRHAKSRPKRNKWVFFNVLCVKKWSKSYWLLLYLLLLQTIREAAWLMLSVSTRKIWLKRKLLNFIRFLQKNKTINWKISDTKTCSWGLKLKRNPMENWLIVCGALNAPIQRPHWSKLRSTSQIKALNLMTSGDWLPRCLKFIRKWLFII